MIGEEGADVEPWLALIIGLVATVALVARWLDARRELASRVYVVLSRSDPAGAAPGHVSVRPTNYGDAPIFGLAVALHSLGHRRRSWRVQPREEWWTGAISPLMLCPGR